jgi:ribonuclease D
MKRRWIWIDTIRKLTEIKSDVASSRIICLDTEYDSFRYFNDKLCLIQLKTERMTYLLDPLNGLDISFLGEPFADPGVLKVLHAGDNDIRLLKRDYGFEFRNIFDTHRAAYILGNHYLALSKLITDYLGVEFSKKKTIQRSQWDNRPLTEEQMAYAALDTAYLPALYERLASDIQEKGLGQMAAAHFENIASLTWRAKDLDPQGHKKIKGYLTLNAEQKIILKKLFGWRFRKARDANRAAFMVMSDQNLLALSKIKAQSRDDLAYAGILSNDKIGQHGDEIINIISGADKKSADGIRTASRTA